MVSTYLESLSDKILLLLIFIVVSLDYFIGKRECYQIISRLWCNSPTRTWVTSMLWLLYHAQLDTHALAGSRWEFPEHVISSSKRLLPLQYPSTTDEHPLAQRDLIPQSQQSSGFKYTPLTAGPLAQAIKSLLPQNPLSSPIPVAVHNRKFCVPILSRWPVIY